MPEETAHKPFKLPDVAIVKAFAPFGWLAKGWADYQRAPLPCLLYGIGLAALSAMIGWALVFSGAFAWMFVLAGGFFFIAPILAMGLYEAARLLEDETPPTLTDMVLVRGAFRLDLAYLGFALLMIYLLWTRLAQIVYALSTYQLHKTPQEFLTFVFTTSDGRIMALTGTAVGAVIALFAFALVVISAPMMLDRRTDVFIATITSFRAVLKNPLPMLLWAIIIAVLTAIGIATAFFGLILIFPLIGLSSWHAYRELVPDRTD